jgi:hypothetical protein
MNVAKEFKYYYDMVNEEFSIMRNRILTEEESQLCLRFFEYGLNENPVYLNNKDLLNKSKELIEWKSEIINTQKESICCLNSTIDNLNYIIEHNEKEISELKSKTIKNWIKTKIFRKKS